MINKFTQSLGAFVFASLITAGANVALASDASGDVRTSNDVIKARILGVSHIKHKNNNFHIDSSSGVSSANSNLKKGFGGEIAYSRYFTDNFSGEFGVGFISTKAKSNFTRTAVVNTAVVNYNNYASKNVYLVPVTATAKLNFSKISAFDPYVGAGIHYTFINSKKGTGVKFKNSVGPVLQAGFDIVGDSNIGFNFDIKHYFMKSDIKFKQFGNAVKAKARINPTVIGLGVTARM